MRYFIISLLAAIMAMPAHAAYKKETRDAFVRGCTSRGDGQPAALQAKLRAACECGIAKVEAAIPESEFEKLGTLPDHGLSKVKPLLQSCVPAQK